MENKKHFDSLRSEYGPFIYKSYSLEKSGNCVNIAYDFEIVGLCSFRPTLSVPLAGLEAVNDFDSPAAKEIIFSLGMTELVSYWKSACCKKVIVQCGSLSEEDILWWKKLYFYGLGEFFYRNGIRADFDTFMEIEAKTDEPAPFEVETRGLNLIPVGGGKDSNVSLELLAPLHEKNRCFIINPRGACTLSAKTAGYGEEDFVTVRRRIDPELLRLNSEGFLNGHTPFSAIVAFSALYCAYLIGAKNIILSNESSANSGNISGTEINHQYSKSYEFEKDFSDYVSRRITDKIKYFSLLRPFSELQIAKRFTKDEKYFSVFKSCNLGSKTDCWCGDCPKCLFVYCILSPFAPEEQLKQIFGGDMLARGDLLDTFLGLIGENPVKPFECVGTDKEVRFALALTLKKYHEEGRELPALLAEFAKFAKEQDFDTSMLSDFNEEHNVPEEFLKYVMEMYKYVSAAD